MFHVSQLKKHIRSKDRVSTTVLPTDPEGQFMFVSVKVLEKRMIRRNNAVVRQWLIQWAHLLVEEATWELADDVMTKYPNLLP